MESEKQTRNKRIDPRLRAAGWHVVSIPFNRSADAAQAIEEFPTTAGPADYALSDSGQPIGVVEAKKLTVGPEGVLTQASRYSRGMEDCGFTLPERHHVPFLYSTNGEIVMFHDVRRDLNRSREVSGFHTLEALREMLGRDAEAEAARLGAIPMHHRVRPYQIEASEAIEQGLTEGKRKMLVTMRCCWASRPPRVSISRTPTTWCSVAIGKTVRCVAPARSTIRSLRIASTRTG